MVCGSPVPRPCKRLRYVSTKIWPKYGQDLYIKEKRFCIFTHFELLAKSPWCPQPCYSRTLFLKTLKRYGHYEIASQTRVSLDDISVHSCSSHNERYEGLHIKIIEHTPPVREFRRPKLYPFLFAYSFSRFSAYSCIVIYIGYSSDSARISHSVSSTSSRR